MTRRTLSVAARSHAAATAVPPQAARGCTRTQRRDHDPDLDLDLDLDRDPDRDRDPDPDPDHVMRVLTGP